LNQNYNYQIAQWLPLDTLSAFHYFADETKLDSLTPDWMRFQVLNKSNQTLQEGTLIDYRLSLHHIPIHWQSQIVDWFPPESFAYLQTKGPFASFKHVHQFEPAEGGCKMTDIVTYRLRGGWLANQFIQPWVHRDLNRIFKIRAKIIQEKLKA
jgi:ligand-binding SRPBCC domain-containing protein